MGDRLDGMCKLAWPSLAAKNGGIENWTTVLNTPPSVMSLSSTREPLLGLIYSIYSVESGAYARFWYPAHIAM